MQRTVTSILTTGAGAVALSVLHLSAAVAATPPELLTKYNCQACHAVDKKLVGPAYKDVAAKYAGDASALEKLEQKVKKGGGGVWGAMPMPPNNVPDPDLKTMVEWVLAQK